MNESLSIREVPVCVVGGAGFLGSHLVNHLIDDRQCDVTVIDNLCAGRREFVHKKARFVHADITLSEDYLRQVFREAKNRLDGGGVTGPLYVFNYAAWPYVPDSYARPSQVCNVNFHGAMNVINAAEAAGAAGILQVSSAEVYGTGGDVKEDHDGEIFSHGEAWPCNEDGIHSPVSPKSTYGASKAAIDFYCQCRWWEAKTPVVALRQFNCLGERETHPYVVPEIIGQLSNKDSIGWGDTPAVVRLGNNSSRDFMYAGDAVRLATILLEKSVQTQTLGEVYNLGSESSIKVYDLTQLVGKVMGFQEVVVEEDVAKKRTKEIWHLQSDNSKLKALIGDFNVSTLESAIARTVEDFIARGRKWCWEE